MEQTHTKHDIHSRQLKLNATAILPSVEIHKYWIGSSSKHVYSTYTLITLEPYHFQTHPLPRHVNPVGQTAIITGSNVGLGFEAAKELALRSISLWILVVRDVSKGAILEDQKVAKTSIEVWSLDQDSYQGMTAFGQRAAALRYLDFVLLNAGLKFKERRVSKTGHETHIAVNYLGTLFCLTCFCPPGVALHKMRASERVWAQAA
ncbi:hypothetical protein F5Y18DRAFT_424523 [Xylariaceae sp. FL1019]|nr:hypothetical protein F5Y18DRAFT_424523 [Xylariaceae sp. FL1019]